MFTLISPGHLDPWPHLQHMVLQALTAPEPSKQRVSFGPKHTPPPGEAGVGSGQQQGRCQPAALDPPFDGQPLLAGTLPPGSSQQPLSPRPPDPLGVCSERPCLPRPAPSISSRTIYWTGPKALMAGGSAGISSPAEVSARNPQKNSSTWSDT